MRLGLVTDIHSHAAPLARALELFRQHHVDQVVTLGDTCDAFTSAGQPAEVVDLLRAAGAVGVWGNHDVGLCRHVSEPTRRRYGDGVLSFMATLHPRLVLGGCHFSHREPTLDLEDPAALWSLDEELPDLAEVARRSLLATTERVLFVGHFHRWLVATAAGVLPWDGTSPLALGRDERYFVIVGPVFEGRCGTFDTATGALTPLNCL